MSSISKSALLTYLEGLQMREKIFDIDKLGYQNILFNSFKMEMYNKILLETEDQIITCLENFYSDPFKKVYHEDESPICGFISVVKKQIEKEIFGVHLVLDLLEKFETFLSDHYDFSLTDGIFKKDEYNRNLGYEYLEDKIECCIGYYKILENVLCETKYSEFDHHQEVINNCIMDSHTSINILRFELYFLEMIELSFVNPISKFSDFIRIQIKSNVDHEYPEIFYSYEGYRVFTTMILQVYRRSENKWRNDLFGFLFHKLKEDGFLENSVTQDIFKQHVLTVYEYKISRTRELREIKKIHQFVENYDRTKARIEVYLFLVP
ncbi:MAG: hypothetical protein NXI00_19135 [Cytophagales bacterium]|nr:hypothetical protein [Cytophagales bacterium]